MNKYAHVVAMILLWIGGLNWGLIGLFGFNLVESFGLPAGVVQLVYVLVGASAVYALITHSSDCMACQMMMKGDKKMGKKK